VGRKSGAGGGAEIVGGEVLTREEIGQFAGELIGGAGLGFFAGVVGKGEAAQGHAIFNECGRRAANRAKRGHGWLQKVRFRLLIKSRPFEAQGKPALQKEKPRRKRGAILNDRIIWDELYDCQMKNWEEPGGAAHKRGRNKAAGGLAGNKSKPAASANTSGAQITRFKSKAAVPRHSRG